jgi:hypothetical protein
MGSCTGKRCIQRNLGVIGNTRSLEHRLENLACSLLFCNLCGIGWMATLGIYIFWYNLYMHFSWFEWWRCTEEQAKIKNDDMLLEWWWKTKKFPWRPEQMKGNVYSWILSWLTTVPRKKNDLPLSDGAHLMSPGARRFFLYNSTYRQGFSSSAFDWVFLAATASPALRLFAKQSSCLQHKSVS